MSRECPLLEAGVSMTGKSVAQALERLSLRHPLPRVIQVDNGSEFFSKAMDTWAYRHGVHLYQAPAGVSLPAWEIRDPLLAARASLIGSGRPGNVQLTMH